MGEISSRINGQSDVVSAPSSDSAAEQRTEVACAGAEASGAPSIQVRHRICEMQYLALETGPAAEMAGRGIWLQATSVRSFKQEVISGLSSPEEASAVKS
jgi:hypothetical protein